MPTLKHDIRSALPPKRIYGAAGEEVEIISVHGHVFIVKGQSGFKYPALASDILDIPAEWLAQSTPPPTAEEHRQPVVAAPPAVATQSPKSSPTKTNRARRPDPPKEENQRSLF
ncbi:MAG TPA: hypothetical protein VFE32_17235 [Puia sp.]|nr:hypothetical protein [Puia sp.]